MVADVEKFTNHEALFAAIFPGSFTTHLGINVR